MACVRVVLCRPAVRLARLGAAVTAAGKLSSLGESNSTERLGGTAAKIIDGLTEAQDIALRFLALVEDKRFAEVRRDALRTYADQALANPHIADAVRNCLRYRREHGVSRPVTKLRSIRGLGASGG